MTPANAQASNDDDLVIDESKELDDYDDDKATDPARIARDTKPPLDSTTVDSTPSGGSGNITGDAGSMGVAMGSGATGAYSSGADPEGVLSTETTDAGGDAP